MSELNTEQIIKALEVCSSNQTCKRCPYEEGILCVDHLMNDGLHIIRQQQVYIEMLETDNVILKRRVKYLEGRLQEELNLKEDLK